IPAWLAPSTTVRKARGRPLVNSGAGWWKGCVQTSESGLHECWGESGLELRGTVNRGYNCPRPLDVNDCFHAQYGSYRCKEKRITHHSDYWCKADCRQYDCYNSWSSAQLHSPLPRFYQALNFSLLPLGFHAPKMSESPDPFTPPLKLGVPIADLPKYTCSSTVLDLRFFPRLDPGMFPFQILLCSPPSLWSPRPLLYPDFWMAPGCGLASLLFK
ncbi:Lymphocyte antigen 6 complex locus protein G5b, partial [Lemmus lemmus]